MKKYKCFRCDYQWVPRISKPVACPKCKSPYWRRPKVVINDEDDFDLIKPENIVDVISEHDINEMPELKDRLNK